jgi:signal transduction histidine kinase/CheY-like chemotaxis protein
VGVDTERILVFVRGSRDGKVTCELLARDGLVPCLCSTLDELCTEIDAGAGAVLVAEEALRKDAVERIHVTLEGQPVWSDVPIVVFGTSGEQRARLLAETIHQLGNVTFLDRPVQVRSMLASVHAAVRSRRRQYETRRAIESRDAFLAMLGHELRNPLGAIRLASMTLHETGAAPAKELDIIERQSLHLSRIVDDLLDVARITRGKVTLRKERVLVAEAVRSAFALMERTAREHLASYDLVVEDEGLWIDGDRQRLEQVLSNLLVNAVKYTQKGGSVTVRVRGDGERVLVTVTDSGIGLSADQRERVFEVFAQAERSLDRSQGGIGVGLSLVRGIMELHEGTVHAESDGVGKGSSFVLGFHRLPAPATTVVEPPAPPAAVGSVAARIVVVEDNDDMRDLLTEMLERSGHEVTCAESGPAGATAILAKSPDVAFVDIGLPEMDGFEVARRVRGAGSRARLVAMTGYGQASDKARAIEAGFDDHLTKPVESKDLMRAIAQARKA